MAEKITRIAIAGEGGQGVQMIAEILAEAANQMGKNAIYIPNFGVEQRGGVSIAFVQISDGPIGAPKFVEADILIPVSPRAVERTTMHAGEDTIYIYDDSLVAPAEVADSIAGAQYDEVLPQCPVEGAEGEVAMGDISSCVFLQPSPGIDPESLPKVKRVIAIPANDIAKQEFHPRVFNIIILGVTIGATDVLPMDEIKKALEVKLGHKFESDPQLREMNYKALDRGYDLIKSIE